MSYGFFSLLLKIVFVALLVIPLVGIIAMMLVCIELLVLGYLTVTLIRICSWIKRAGGKLVSDIWSLWVDIHPFKKEFWNGHSFSLLFHTCHDVLMKNWLSDNALVDILEMLADRFASFFMRIMTIVWDMLKVGLLVLMPSIILVLTVPSFRNKPQIESVLQACSNNALIQDLFYKAKKNENDSSKSQIDFQKLAEFIRNKPQIESVLQACSNNALIQDLFYEDKKNENDSSKSQIDFQKLAEFIGKLTVLFAALTLIFNYYKHRNDEAKNLIKDWLHTSEGKLICDVLENELSVIEHPFHKQDKDKTDFLVDWSYTGPATLIIQSKTDPKFKDLSLTFAQWWLNAYNLIEKDDSKDRSYADVLSKAIRPFSLCLTQNEACKERKECQECKSITTLKDLLEVCKTIAEQKGNGIFIRTMQGYPELLKGLEHEVREQHFFNDILSPDLLNKTPEQLLVSPTTLITYTYYFLSRRYLSVINAFYNAIADKKVNLSYAEKQLIFAFDTFFQSLRKVALSIKQRNVTYDDVEPTVWYWLDRIEYLIVEGRLKDPKYEYYSFVAHYIIRDYPEIFELLARRHLDWQISWRKPRYRTLKQQKHREAYNAVIKKMISDNEKAMKKATETPYEPLKFYEDLAIELSELKRIQLLKKSLYVRMKCESLKE
jgi:hypothetical protein